MGAEGCDCWDYIESMYKGQKSGSLTDKWTPAQLTGKDGFKFLEEIECLVQYKNYAEIKAGQINGFKITKPILLAFIENQIS